MTKAQAVIEHAIATMAQLHEAILLCQEYPSTPDIIEDRARVAQCRAAKEEQLRRARAAGWLTPGIVRGGKE